MKITPEIFHAYLKCPTKCWLRAKGESPSGNPYAEWVKTQNEHYRATGTERLVAVSPDAEAAVSPERGEVKTAKWRLATSLVARTEMDPSVVESEVHAIERVPSEGRGKPAQFIPIRFIFTNKLGKDDKLLVGFDAFVLSEMLGREVQHGKIIHGDNHDALKVKTSALASEVRKRIKKIAELLAGPTPPDLVLNRHCAECEFQSRCRNIAIEKDDLSLLSGMSAKERQKLRSKGIFTVTQLSYTFRPRRRPKKQRDKREKYHHSLKALAIREKKIHIVGTPELKIEGTPVYLDVEGLPDRDFYYLIGLRIGNGDSGVQRSLWADTVADEGKIWGEFLAILETVEKPVLIHYGSYETTFISNMRNRHGSPPENSVPALAIGAAFNLVSFMFGRIYFPTFSNRLKELASMLGARWSSAASSGLQSLLWRHEWETSGGQGMRDRLIEYNQEDCTALLLLVNELGSVIAGSQTRQDVDFADAPKSPMTNRATEIQRAFNAVRLSANSDPSKSRIRLTPDGSARLKPSRGKRSSRKSIKPKLPAVKGRIIRVATKRKCPAHPENPGLLISEKRLHTRSLADIAFTKTGPRKTVLRMVGRAGRCPICATKYFPPAFSRIKNHQYGSGFSVWVVYLRLVLRLPYRLIVQFTRDLFNVEMSTAKSEEFVRQCAADYASTEETLYEKLLQSPSIHVDETKLSILGSHQFVWVLTDGKHVIFRMTDSRETGFLQPLLAEYRGTLVSDFYGGYDAIPCQQQKCLVQRNR